MSIKGLKTGFVGLDTLGGLQKGKLYVLGGRPSMGKTALALSLADNIAVKNKVPAIMFSLEMTKEQLINRMLSMEGRVAAKAVHSGELNDSEWEMLAEAANTIGKSGLIVDDTAAISIGELCSKCRRCKMEYDLQLVIIDYLQLVTSDDRENSREEEISEISRSLKALAKELDIAVIAFSQVSRACDIRPDHRPIIDDLVDSGSLAQDADVIMFLYRDEYYNKKLDDNKGKAELIIVKPENGIIGTAYLQWLPDSIRFVD